LTFSAFDLDDFDNGVGQFQVLVNGHLVVDIPAGLNHLSGSGDYAPYTNTWVKFGPFDITGFVVQGQNTIVFRNPLVSHDGLVRNVTITQGNTVLLQVLRASSVEPGEPTTYTFSIPALRITSFNGQSSPSSGQTVKFTATYTGGTGPFRCVFRFGDDQSAVILGGSSSCSATHSFDDQGTFRVSVRVIGNSTSDVQTARLFVTVPQIGSTVLVAASVRTGIPASAVDEDDFTDS
jgi:PKD repeat protein